MRFGTIGETLEFTVRGHTRDSYAYGALAALLPQTRHLAQGLALAHSLTVDPHKTLFVPFEAGAVLLREPQWLPETFGLRADYLPGLGEDTHFHYRDYGPQLSRTFRALKIYLTLKIYGLDAITQALAETVELAHRFASLIEDASDFELLAPVPLGIVAFRYRTTQKGPVPDERLDALNAALIPELQRRGKAFLATTRLRGRVALRAGFLSFRTQESDLPVVLDAIREAAQVVMGGDGLVRG